MRQLSPGQRVRAGVAAALVHSPPLVIPEEAGLSGAVGAGWVLVAGLAGPVPDLTGLEGARHPDPEASGLRCWRRSRIGRKCPA